MKVLMLAALALVFVTPVKAQETPQAATQINTLNDALTTYHIQIKDMDDNVFPTLKSRRINIDITNAKLRDDFKALKAKYADLNKRIDSHQAEMDAHNTKIVDKRCKPCLADYDAEAQDLELATADLVIAKTAADKEKKTLLNNFNQVAQDLAVWLRDAAKATNDFNALAAQADLALTQIQAAASAYGVCADKYPHDDDTGLRKDCGDVKFDDIRAAVEQLKHIRK